MSPLKLPLGRGEGFISGVGHPAGTTHFPTLQRRGLIFIERRNPA
jgi:hypothetical protein